MLSTHPNRDLQSPLAVAILLSAETFEGFFTQSLGFSRDRYLESYRNGWSWDYASALRRKGVRPTIYVCSLVHSGLETTEDGFRIRFLPIAAPYRLWERARILHRTPVGRYIAQVAHTLCVLRALRRSLAEDGIDVLYIQEFWTARFDLLALALDLPVVGADHGGDPWHQLKLLKRASFRRAVCMTVQSDEQLSLVKAYGGNAVMLRNAVDTDFWSPSESDVPAERRLLTIARLEDKQKRTSDLVRSMAHLAGWRLDVVGTGTDEELLRDLADSLMLGDRVNFLGFVSDKEHLRRLITTCSVFALPSAWEAAAISLLEAMSCGASVVASDISTFRDLIDSGHNGFLTAVGDPERLAQAVLIAAEKRDGIGAAARQTVLQRYSQNVFADELVARLYEASNSRH